MYACKPGKKVGSSVSLNTKREVLVIFRRGKKHTVVRAAHEISIRTKNKTSHFLDGRYLVGTGAFPVRKAK